MEVRPEATPTLVVFAPTNTKALTPTGPNTCPGAKPQRVEAGGRGSVCTKKDRLILRKDPTLTSAEVRRIPTGTEFKIISGPKCGEDSSWWLIQTDDGTSGWVREGSDEVDPYFICPVFRD